LNVKICDFYTSPALAPDFLLFVWQFRQKHRAFQTLFFEEEIFLSKNRFCAAPSFA